MDLSQITCRKLNELMFELFVSKFGIGFDIATILALLQSHPSSFDSLKPTVPSFTLAILLNSSILLHYVNDLEIEEDLKFYKSLSRFYCINHHFLKNRSPTEMFIFDFAKFSEKLSCRTLVNDCFLMIKFNIRQPIIFLFFCNFDGYPRFAFFT